MGDVRNPIWLSFRAAVTGAMERMGLKGYELAQRVGVNPSSVTGWLKEGSIPKGETLVTLARVLRMEPVELVSGTGKAAPQRGSVSSASRSVALSTIAEFDVRVNAVLREMRQQWERDGHLAKSLEESAETLEREERHIAKGRRRKAGS